MNQAFGGFIPFPFPFILTYNPCPCIILGLRTCQKSLDSPHFQRQTSHARELKYGRTPIIVDREFRGNRNPQLVRFALDTGPFLKIFISESFMHGHIIPARWHQPVLHNPRHSAAKMLHSSKKRPREKTAHTNFRPTSFVILVPFLTFKRATLQRVSGVECFHQCVGYYY